MRSNRVENLSHYGQRAKRRANFRMVRRLAPREASLVISCVICLLPITGCSGWFFGGGTIDQLVINEVAFDPVGADAGNEWIEIFNPGPDGVALKGWLLSTTQTPRPLALPGWTIPAGRYLVIHLGQGTDSSFVSGSIGRFHTGTREAALDNDGGEIALYACSPSPACLVDYFAYAFSDSIVRGPGYQHALAVQKWPDAAVFDDGLFAQEGHTLGRDSRSTDTNDPVDWAGWGGIHATGSTAGGRNEGELAYVLSNSGIPPSPCDGSPPARVTAEHQRHINRLLDALRQIRREHLDLLTGFDTGMGGGEPTVDEHGDVRIDSLRLRFGNDLNPDGNTAGGRTCPPDQPDGEILILLDPSVLKDLWRLKEALFHELVHAGFDRSTTHGFWRPVQTTDGIRHVDSGEREYTGSFHEAVAYALNFQMLDSIRTEFVDHAEDIDTRKMAKVRFMEHFLRQAIGNLPRVRRSNVYGRPLEELLQTYRRRFIEMKLWAARHENGISRKEQRDIVARARELGMTDDELLPLLER